MRISRFSVLFLVMVFFTFTLTLISGCEKDKETWPDTVASTDTPSNANTSAADGTPTEPVEVKSLVVTAVDPYILGAQFCIDANQNGSCDQGTDPFSKEDTENPGQYIFQDYTPATDLNILTVKAGLHNGKAYPLNLKGTVSANSATAVITPATTITDKGITQAEWVIVLNQFSDQFGTVFNESDLSLDPMVDLYKKDHAELSSANLARLRMQITSYAMQRLLQSTQSLRDLNGTTLIASATLGDGDGDGEDKLYKIMEKLVEASNKAVDPATFDLFLKDTTYNNIPANVRPALTVQDFSSTAMTIIDNITEQAHKQSVATTGSLNPIIQAIDDQLPHIINRTTQLAKRYFAANHQTEFEEDNAVNIRIRQNIKADDDMKAGLDCSSGYFEITTDFKMQCIESTATTTP